MACTGLGDQGLELIELAFRLSPRDPRTSYLLMMTGWTHLILEQYAEAEKIFRRSLGLNGELIWSWLGHAMALAMEGESAEATGALAELKRLAPDFELDDLAILLKNIQGNPTGERGAVIDRQINSVRDIWPSGEAAG